MKTRFRTKLIHEGNYVAKVSVTLIESDHEWAPYLSMEDAYKLDDVREALRKGDIKSASQYGQIYLLKPVSS